MFRITCTVFFEDPFWVGVWERADEIAIPPQKLHLARNRATRSCFCLSTSDSAASSSPNRSQTHPAKPPRQTRSGHNATQRAPCSKQGSVPKRSRHSKANMRRTRRSTKRFRARSATPTWNESFCSGRKNGKPSTKGIECPTRLFG